MKTTYVLLVGINDYPSPISGLNGCLKDLDQIEHYLSKYVANDKEELFTSGQLLIRSYGSLKICRLENQYATYQNIIKGFRTFLCQAGAEDVAWFHFSGHGSEVFTANEFLVLEPNGKDQTLVCYQSKQEDEQLHLADKELAVLLHEVATQDVIGQAKESPHLVVSLDCCHSGSGTRDFAEDPQLKTRGIKIYDTSYNILARKEGTDGRLLESYIDGYYAKQWQEKQSLEIPTSCHVLLSACEPIEKAGDLPLGGIFTTSMMTTLMNSKGPLNYTDLFVRTRATALKLRQEQNPKFETIGSFYPYTRFLDGAPLGSPEWYEVVFEAGQWLVKCGAIHGLPMQSKQSIELKIFADVSTNQAIASAQIKGVGAQKSSIHLRAGEAMMNQESDYQATIAYWPASPTFVWLHGDPQGLQLLKDRWDTSRNVQWLSDSDLDVEADLEIEVSSDKFLLSDRRNGRHLLSTPKDIDNAVLMIDSLKKIVTWKRTAQLDNPRSSLSKLVSFELGIANKKMEKTFFSAPEVRLYVSKDTYFFNADNHSLSAPFFPNLIVKNTKWPLYAYLFHLRANYSIDAYEGEVAFRPAEHPGKTELLIPMWKKTIGWGLSAEEAESTSYFKLLVTTESLDYQQLLQGGLGRHRDPIFRWNPIAVSDDWCSFTTKVTLVRATQMILVDTPVSFGGNKSITIQAHSGVSANVSLVAAPVNPYSADPSTKFVRFQSPALKLLDFSSLEKQKRQQLLELTQLKVSTPSQLQEQPLEVIISAQLEKDEILFALAFDGQHYRIIGGAKRREEQQLVSLRELPDVAITLPTDLDMIPSPLNPDEIQHRSLFENLKISFFRLKLTQADTRQFAWVDFTESSKILTQKDRLPEKVAAAQKIALLLPSIIGESNSTAAYWKLVLAREQPTLQANFDLVLTYDFHYPASIESQALPLFSQLEVQKTSVISFMEEIGALRW